MTRWARRCALPAARALPATPWEQLAPGGEHGGARRGRRKKDYENQDVNGFAAFRGEQRREEEEARRKDRRRESRRLRRQERKKNAMVCFHCREPGHVVADCPAVLESQDMGTGICYRCGSTEHDISKCRAKVDPAAGPFPYAKCFICGEMGHLSRSCPDNPKGLYAEDGGCKLCGSVEHFKKDCPEKQNAEQVTVGRWTPGLSADHEDITATQRCRKHSPRHAKLSFFEGLLALKQFSCAASLWSGDDREWIQEIKQTAKESLVFCLPSFFQFASQTCLAHKKAGNNRNTASGYFIKGTVGVF